MGWYIKSRWADDLLVELGPQRLNNLYPVCMSRQAPARGAANAMLAIKLDIQRVKDVATRADGDLDAVVEGGNALRIDRRVSWHFVQLERDLRKVVELRDGGSLDLGLQAALQNAVQQGVNVRFFGEVDEGLGFI